MILMELLARVLWSVWLATTLLMKMGLLALAIERSRRKADQSIVSTAPGGTVLMGQTRGGGVLLIVRAPDHRLGEGALAEAETDDGGA